MVMVMVMDKRGSNRNWALIFILLLFAVISVWWVVLLLIKPGGDYPKLLWAASYGSMALFGGLYGLFAAKDWGSFKSSFGRAIIFLACGFLLAVFWHLVF